MKETTGRTNEPLGDRAAQEERIWAEAFRPLRPGVTPGAALTRRVAALAAAADAADGRKRTFQRHQNQRQFLLGFSASIVILAAVITAVVLGPRMVLASTLRAVSKNLHRAAGIHYRVTFLREGRKTLSYEVWQRDGQWRLETQGKSSRLIEIHAAGKFWHYDPARGIASYQSNTEAAIIRQNVQSLQRLQAQARQALGSRDAEDLGTVTRRGRRLQRIGVPTPVQRTPFSGANPGRTVFTIDRSRMLPALTEHQLRENGRWTTVAQTELDLEGSVSPNLFAIPSRGVRIYDLRAYGAQVGSRFARPLASKRFATRTIALRDVQVNRDGDLFILYTDGSTPKKNRLVFPDSIPVDDRGTTYTGTAGGIEPFMYHENPQLSRGMVVDGEVMQGFCVVPLVPVTPLPTSALPTKVTITFGFTERQGNKKFSGRTRFTVPVRRTESLLPTYAPDLAILMLDGGEEQFKQTRESGRRMHYSNGQDWSGMIESTGRAIGQGVVDVHTYLDRATAFGQLGRPEQARQALSAARARDELGWYADQIKRAEEGLRPGL